MTTAENLTLLTDLYQLTMAQAYFREQRMEAATFSLFIRSYPLNRGYFVAAGLRDVLDYLQTLSFDTEAVEYLASQNLFSDDFLNYLGDLKFSGDVGDAGRAIFFADEPVLHHCTTTKRTGETVINQPSAPPVATSVAASTSAAGGRWPTSRCATLAPMPA
jgi:nicotinate phosphoribosyltransferase